ncbi:MAG TPA: phosphoserine transaminase, partial [Motilibacteraceae bacterium]|nr:phosphoserine transaminase [Motilibacteraceae bacterium]
MSDAAQIVIPAELKPADGRFGSGPSKVRPEQVEALGRVATTYLGTSHRQSTVRSQVRRLREGLAALF